MPISIPSLARRAIGNIIDPEDIARLHDAILPLDGAATGDEWATADAALTPGDEGQIKATVSGVVANVKPGRIDARVRGVSTAASDNTTALQAIIDNADGAEIWIPEGEYKAVPLLKNGTRINGVGTIKAPSGFAGETFIQPASGEGDHASIRGVTIDAGGDACAIGIYDGCTDVTIEDVVCKNLGDEYNRDLGVRFIGPVRLTTRRVRVEGGGGAIAGYNPVDSIFEDCIGIDQTGNAFGAIASGGSFVGRGNHWRRLVSRGTGRMGLEIFGETGGVFEGGSVEQCDFEVTGGGESDQMGYSIVAIRHALVAHNQAYSPNAVPQYGFEVGGHELEVIGNLAIGFAVGFATNSNSYCTIMGNRSLRAHEAFQVVGSGSGQFGHIFLANIAQSFRDIAFGISTQSELGSGGHILDGNRAIRDLAWADDSSRDMKVFKVSTGAKSSPIGVINNRVDWAETSPAVGLVMNPYQFISTTPGDLVGTYHRNNSFRKRNSTNKSYLNTTNGSDADDDVVLTSNTKTNYLGVTTDMNDFNAGPYTS